ncbi:MASE1 domain-containing protein [Ramlibacter sp. 2FC]|uniref:MASE1 domain-containing protein n=1 Tax=Ramlibacter sp. 2FC TaxID=2502188 RepID=UPI0010F5624A|nr:MASE1 domain-containing protein [Ramlibacter sp. 2FC]
MHNNGTGIRFCAQLTGVALLYTAAAIGGLMYAVVGNTVTLLWAPSGIALAALLGYGYRLSVGIALGAFLANAWTGIALLVAAGIALGNTLEALVGAYLLQRLAGFRNALDRRRDVLALVVLAAMLGTMASASVGVAVLALGGIVTMGDYASVWLKWWLGDMMGVLVVAPPLLVWLSHPRRALSPPRLLEALGLGAMLLLVSHKIFGAPELAGHGYYPASLAVFPFVIWAALRFGQWGASLVTLAVSLLAIVGTSRGTGPFVVDDPVDSLMRWCTFANVVAVSGLLLAASVAEQQRAQADLKRSHDELERRVDERTRDLADSNAGLQREMAERRRLESELIRASEEQQKAIGRELHDGLGQHLTSLALFSASLQQTLAERARPEVSLARRIRELIEQAIAMTRSVARGLYPAALESDGLAAALEQLAEHTRSLQGVACVFRADPHLRVRDPLVAINLYRVAQEAINNAVKHSQASQLRIDLAQVEGQHRLAISDDGIGLDPERVWRGQGLGMHSMRYRASLLGGRFAVERNAQGGTTIAIIYPGEPREQPALS